MKSNKLVNGRPAGDLGDLERVLELGKSIFLIQEIAEIEIEGEEGNTFLAYVAGKEERFGKEYLPYSQNTNTNMKCQAIEYPSSTPLDRICTYKSIPRNFYPIE